MCRLFHVSMIILTLLIIPVNEHRIFFHLLVFSLISLINILYFSVFRSFNFLVNSFLGIFFLYVAIINENVIVHLTLKILFFPILPSVSSNSMFFPIVLLTLKILCFSHSSMCIPQFFIHSHNSVLPQSTA